MGAVEWIVKVLAVVSDLVAGFISHDEAKQKMAELAAIETGVDALERAKLSGG